MNRVKQLFSSQSVQDKNKLIYRYILLNLYFSICTLPWLLVNSLIRISPQTFLIYAIVAVWLFPNIQTLMKYFSQEKMSENITLKDYIRELKGYLKSGLFIGGGTMTILTVLLFELMIVLANEQLKGMFPIFFIGIITISISGLFLLKLNLEKGSSFKKNIKFSLVLGWHNFFKTLICFLILSMWLSVGYQIPILNFLIGNVAFAYILDKVMTKFLTKYISRRQSFSR